VHFWWCDQDQVVGFKSDTLCWRDTYQKRKEKKKENKVKIKVKQIKGEDRVYKDIACLLQQCFVSRMKVLKVNRVIF
jgi:hypothetical protein